MPEGHGESVGGQAKRRCSEILATVAMSRCCGDGGSTQKGRATTTPPKIDLEDLECFTELAGGNTGGSAESRGESRWGLVAHRQCDMDDREILIREQPASLLHANGGEPTVWRLTYGHAKRGTEI